MCSLQWARFGVLRFAKRDPPQMAAPSNFREEPQARELEELSQTPRCNRVGPMALKRRRASGARNDVISGCAGEKRGFLQEFCDIWCGHDHALIMDKRGIIMGQTGHDHALIMAQS